MRVNVLDLVGRARGVIANLNPPEDPPMIRRLLSVLADTRYGVRRVAIHWQPEGEDDPGYSFHVLEGIEPPDLEILHRPDRSVA